MFKATDQILDALNDALSRDPLIVNELFNSEFVCNRKLGEHPTLPVLWHISSRGAAVDYCTIAPLDFINMVLAELNHPLICAHREWDSDGTIIVFGMIDSPHPRDVKEK